MKPDTTQWSELGQAYQALLDAPLSPANVQAWLQQWSDLEAQLSEDAGNAASRSHENTADTEAEARHLHYLREILPRQQVANERLVRRLLALEGYEAPAEQQMMMRDFAVSQQLFREANVPLSSEINVLANDYRKLTGQMSIEWEGQTLNLNQADLLLAEPERPRREAAWRAIHDRWLADREPLNALYLQMLDLRRQIADNAGFDTYRDYVWLERGRYDYTPAQAFAFHEAIEQEVVPVARRLYAAHRAELEVPSLRPWDLDAEASGVSTLRPFEEVAELEAGCARIFHAIDPVLGEQFELLRGGDLELSARPNKAAGGYCRSLPVSGRSYIFMNAAGQHDNVQTLLHEGGHAFHNQHSLALPLLWMRKAPMEMAEVASMGMELLAHPYFEREKGGFYERGDADRARAEHLKKIVLFLPYMAVVDAFQHWVYSEAPRGVTAEALDAKWGSLWERFMGGIDFEGLEAEKVTGWHRKRHIFLYPFYYIEYGLAQVGALQLWRNALQEQGQALEAYRRALALGGSRPLPALYEAAGVRFAFDGPTLRELMALVVQQLANYGYHLAG